MESFTITIQRKIGTSWPIIVELSGAKTRLPIRREGLLELDLEALSTQVTPRDYGTMLGQALFRDRIREAFLQARIQSQDRLSVQLCVEAPELRTLRWERLCAPLDEQWQFLLLDQRAPLTLALPSAAGRYFPPIGRADLRALVLVASPQGLERYRLAPFDVATTVASVRTAFGSIPCDVLSTTPDAVGLPTLDALCERLTSTSYTLLHIVCHGRYSTDISDTVLYLENEEHQVDPVTASRLLDRLSQLRGERGLPHFVFLATCESASPQAEGALGGLAQRLVRELGLPAVLAMTEPVSLRTAETLSSTFYQRLCAHGHLDLALSEACAGLAERPDSTVAALYSRLGARPLFEQQRPSSIAISADQQNRTNLLKALGKAYREALSSSLQEVASIRLTMRERLDLTEAEVPTSWQLPQKERLVPEGTTILDVYDDANTGLLILGSPGAGKSTLLYELAHALLKRAAQNESFPVPVVLHLSLWATKRLLLSDWIVEQLELRYYVPRKLGQRWQRDERWLLLLDGLDEVALAARPACVEAINTYLSSRTRLVSPVVCSRLEDYEALREPLRLPNVVVVQPLTPEQIDTYLSRAGPSLAAVRQVVQRNSVLHELLNTPLMLHAVILAYRDKAVTDLPQLGLAEVQQRHIFASYLQRMLPVEGKRSPPSSKKMLHSLVWLAQQMRAHHQSVFYLEQLQLDWVPVSRLFRIYKALFPRLTGMLIGMLMSLLVTSIFFPSFFSFQDSILFGGLIGGLVSGNRAMHFRFEVLLRSWKRKWRQLLCIGVGVGLFTSVITWIETYPPDPYETQYFFGTVIITGLGCMLLSVLVEAGKTPTAQMSNQRQHQSARMDHVRLGVLVGLLMGLIEGLPLGIGLWVGASIGPPDGVVSGLEGGLSFGITALLLSFLLLQRGDTIECAEIIVWSMKRFGRSLLTRRHLGNTFLIVLLVVLVSGLSWGLYFVLHNGFGWYEGLFMRLQAGLSQGGVMNDNINSRYR